MSILDYELIHGTFTAIIADCEEVPALINNTTVNDPHLPENAIIRDAYLKISLKLNTGDTVETRWYSKRIPYIMRCIRNQTSEEIYKLSELIKYCRKNPITITITEDPKYGQQIEYEV